MNWNDLKKKFFVSSITKLVASFGVFVFNIFIIYSTEYNTLGILNSAISLIIFLSIFTKFGLHLATLKLISIFFEDKNIFKINQLIIQSIIISGTISILFALTIIIFENFIALSFYKTDEIKGVLKIFAITLPIFTFVQLQKSLFKSFKIPELSVLSDIGAILFLTSLMMLGFQLILELTIYRISIFFLFSCLLIFSLNNFILFYVMLKKSESINFKKINISDTKLVKSLPDYFLIDFINFITVWGSIFLISFFLDFKTVGFFSSTYWMAYSLLFFPLVLNSIYAPYFAINLNKKNKIKQKKKFFENRNLSLLITMPIFIVLFFFSSFILEFILKIYLNEFDLIFKILLINSLIRIIFGPQTLFINMSNDQKTLKFILITTGLLQFLGVIISLVFFDLIILSASLLITNFFKHVWLRKVLVKKLEY